MGLVRGTVTVSASSVTDAQAIPTRQTRSTAYGGFKAPAAAGTPVSLGSQPVASGVFVVANPNNTGKVYVFPTAGAKTDVVPLNAGDSDWWPVSDISALKIDADVSGEGVYWKGAN